MDILGQVGDAVTYYGAVYGGAVQVTTTVPQPYEPRFILSSFNITQNSNGTKFRVGLAQLSVVGQTSSFDIYVGEGCRLLAVSCIVLFYSTNSSVLTPVLASVVPPGYMDVFTSAIATI